MRQSGLDVPLIYPFSTFSKKKAKKSVMSVLCHERLTWPIDASRGGVAGWKVVSYPDPLPLVGRVWVRD